MFKKSSRVLLVTLLLFVLAGATYAFAATNTFDGSNFAGDGNSNISGYVVSNISYATSLGNISGVSFTLNAPSNTVQASLNGGTLVNCSGTTVTNGWSCSFSGVSVADASTLRVVAVQ
jgi:hypothetical protein